MRILLVNNLFQPEPNHLKGLAFASELRRRGHDVQVLTGFPNYPAGRLYPGYRMRWTLREELDGVPITRVASYLSHDASAGRRILSYASLAAAQAAHALVAAGRFDVTHVYMGPLTLMWPARVRRAFRGTRIVADVQDIWPESVTNSGMLGGGLAARLLDAWCRRSYAGADRLVVLSQGYKDALVTRGLDPARIDVVHNWCDERALQAEVGAGAEKLLEPGPFNVLYAGNLGKLQGLDAVLDAAKLLREASPAVRLLVVGDGVEHARLARRVADEGLVNVRMPGRVAPEVAAGLQRRADALLIHLVPTPLTRIGIPQKVQAYMAAGRPILLAGEGDAAALLRRARAGRICRPGDPAAIAAAVRELAGLPRGALAELGANGEAFYRAELSFTRGVDRMVEVFTRALEEG